MTTSAAAYKWEWIGEGTDDIEPERGRTYYSSVIATSTVDGSTRIYHVGDPVIVASDNDDIWVAQVVEFFHARSDDEELANILLTDIQSRTKETMRYSLMRCTLRWLYNKKDVDVELLRSTSIGSFFKKELFFSDHVESSGYHDIQVIEGRAWLKETKQDQLAFRQNPHPEFRYPTDKTRIVRAFFKYGTAVRKLCPGELEWLIQNPTTDKDLYKHSRMCFRGALNQPALLPHQPSFHRRSTSTMREPINMDADEYDPQDDRSSGDDSSSGRSSTSDEYSPNSRKGKKRRRRRVTENDMDDQDNTVEQDQDPGPNFPEWSDSPVLPRQSLDVANKEVLSLINELQDGMDMDMMNPTNTSTDLNMDMGILVPASALDSDELPEQNRRPSPPPNSSPERKSPAKVNEVIDLDGRDGPDILTEERKTRELARERLRLKITNTLGTKPTNRKIRQFMPTARLKKKNMSPLSIDDSKRLSPPVPKHQPKSTTSSLLEERPKPTEKRSILSEAFVEHKSALSASDELNESEMLANVDTPKFPLGSGKAHSKPILGKSRRLSTPPVDNNETLSEPTKEKSRRLSEPIGGERRMFSGSVEDKSQKLSEFSGGNSHRLSEPSEGKSRKISQGADGRSPKLADLASSQSDQLSKATATKSRRLPDTTEDKIHEALKQPKTKSLWHSDALQKKRQLSRSEGKGHKLLDPPERESSESPEQSGVESFGLLEEGELENSGSLESGHERHRELVETRNKSRRLQDPPANKSPRQPERSEIESPKPFKSVQGSRQLSELGKNIQNSSDPTASRSPRSLIHPPTISYTHSESTGVKNREILESRSGRNRHNIESGRRNGVLPNPDDDDVSEPLVQPKAKSRRLSELVQGGRQLKGLEPEGKSRRIPGPSENKNPGPSLKHCIKSRRLSDPVETKSQPLTESAQGSRQYVQAEGKSRRLPDPPTDASSTLPKQPETKSRRLSVVTEAKTIKPSKPAQRKSYHFAGQVKNKISKNLNSHEVRKTKLSELTEGERQNLPNGDEKRGIKPLGFTQSIQPSEALESRSPKLAKSTKFQSSRLSEGHEGKQMMASELTSNKSCKLSVPTAGTSQSLLESTEGKNVDVSKLPRDKSHDHLKTADDSDRKLSGATQDKGFMRSERIVGDDNQNAEPNTEKVITTSKRDENRKSKPSTSTETQHSRLSDSNVEQGCLPSILSEDRGHRFSDVKKTEDHRSIHGDEMEKSPNSDEVNKGKPPSLEENKTRAVSSSSSDEGEVDGESDATKGRHVTRASCLQHQELQAQKAGIEKSQTDLGDMETDEMSSEYSEEELGTEDIEREDEEASAEEDENSTSPDVAPEAFSQLNVMLMKLKAEFENISPKVQKLYANRIEMAVESVISKVNSVGMSYMSDQQMALVVEEIIADLKSEMSKHTTEETIAANSEYMET